MTGTRKNRYVTFGDNPGDLKRVARRTFFHVFSGPPLLAVSMVRNVRCLFAAGLIFLVGQNSGCTVYRKVFHRAQGGSGYCTGTLEKARSLMWERSYQKALAVLDEAAFQCGQSAEIQEMRGDIYYTLENWRKAEDAYQDVLRLEPGDPEAVVRLWFIDVLKNRYTERARKELETKALSYLDADPEDPGRIYAAVLGLDGARAESEKMEVIRKYERRVKKPSWRKHMAELFFYGSLRMDKERLLESTRFFRKAFPEDRLRYNMARMALSSIKAEGGTSVQSECRDILSHDPRNRVLNYLCAEAILDVGGNLDVAEEYIQKAIRAARNPDPRDRYPYVDDRTWNRLMEGARAQYRAVYGRIKFLQGDYGQAVVQFEKGLSHSPRCRDLHLWYGDALEKGGRFDEALFHYRRAAELGDSEKAVCGMKRILSLRGIDICPAEYFAGIEGIPRFTDVSDQAGLAGVTGERVAWSDLNMDRYPDLVIAGRTVFENNRDGTFRDITESCGVDHSHPSGGILADFDNNGFPDLIAFTGQGGPRLYLNRFGEGKRILMEDVTDTALPVWPVDTGPTESAAAADVNGDGAVDIYFADYENSGPERGRGSSDVFYLNRGDGTFLDATALITYSSLERMCGRGASFADFNGDGRPDLFVANYRLDPNFLLVNESGNGPHSFRLVDRAEELGVRGRDVRGAYGHSIGGAWGWLGTDRPALFVSNLAHPRLLGLSDTSVLYLPSSENRGFDPHFEDLGFFYQETYSDPSFEDVDLDGHLDLFITSVYRNAPSVLYLNRDDRFVNIAWEAGARVYNGWGAAWADYDRDGDMDLVVCSGNKPVLLRNEAQKLNRTWLEVRAVGTHSPTTGIGAKVVIRTADGGKKWVREIRAGRGTGNQDEPVAHFGLGTDKGPFKVTVYYPSGMETVRDDVSCCQLIEVIEP